MMVNLDLKDAEATERLGAQLATTLGAGGVIFLHGDLGAGKTTLVRGFLHALGYAGNVKSPTYTLVEPYETGAGPIFHFDLYRLMDPEELEFMGIRDFFTPQARCLVEWPEKGSGYLPAPDVSILLTQQGNGRLAEIEGHTVAGDSVVRGLRG